ncbi:MAG: amidohydrolase family protein [Myxococcota bacterium]
MSADERILLGCRRVVLPGDNGLMTAPAAVEVDPETGLIDAVYPLPEGAAYRDALTELADELGAQVDDLGDGVLTPAFVDVHTHLGLVVLRGTGVEEASAGDVVEDLFYRFEHLLTAEDVDCFVRMGAYEALMSGTGLVWDHYFYGETVAKALSDVGLTAVVAPTLEDVFGPQTGQVEAQIEATLALASGSAPPGIFAAFGPHATDTVSLGLWERVAELSETHQLPFHAHLAQSLGEVERTRAREGCTPVELLERAGVLERAPAALLVHDLYVTRAELERIAASQAYVQMGFCPRSQRIFAFPADPGLWDAAGLDWSIGTDCPASNDAASMAREITALAGIRGHQTSGSEAYRAFVEGGDPEAVWTGRQADHAQIARQVAPSELLSRAWSVPGDLHPQVQAGVIAPGALANVVLWDMDHPAMWPSESPLRALAYSAPTAAITQVMTRGQWRGTRGDFARSLIDTEEYRAVLAEATARRSVLLHKSGLR